MGLPAAGEVRLLHFPFSDLSQTKLRPAVILAGAGREDWIVCQITSNPLGDSRAVALRLSDFSSGMLQHTSYVRPGKVFTAHESLIGGILGTLKPAVFSTVRNAVIAVIQQS